MYQVSKIQSNRCLCGVVCVVSCDIRISSAEIAHQYIQVRTFDMSTATAVCTPYSLDTCARSLTSGTPNYARARPV